MWNNSKVDEVQFVNSIYYVSWPAEGSRLPSTVCTSSASQDPRPVFCWNNRGITLQPYYSTNSNVNQKTAVNICCACSVCSLNQQKKLRIVYVLLLKDIPPQQQCSETKSSRLLLLRFLSLHYLYPQPGCVNMRPHEREYIIQVQAQNERPGVMNAGCGSDRFEYVMRNPALAVCGVHGINNTVCN